MVFVTDTLTIKKFMKQLAENGCVCTEDYEDKLTVEAKDGDKIVYKGVQKGKDQSLVV